MKQVTKIFIALALSIFFGLSACKKTVDTTPLPKPVKVTPVVNYSATVGGGEGKRYSATIQPSSQVSLAFKVGGYVQNLGGTDGRSLGVGDYVGQGDVLATLRQADYRVRVDQARNQTNEVRAALQTAQAQAQEARSARATANSQLEEARRAIETVKAQIAQAQATYEKAAKDWTRAQNLYAKESLTKVDYDAAKAQYESSAANLNGAQAQLRTAEQRVETARGQIKQIQAKIDTAEGQINQTRAKIQTSETGIKEAQIPLEDTILRAPSGGVIIERRVEIGSLVSPGTVAYSIAQVGAVKAVFGVPDVELRTLRVGQSLKVTSDAIPNTEFPGNIARISPSADPNSRVFDVEASINNFNGSLKPNMVVSLQSPGETATQTELPVIPLSAIVRSKTNPNAYSVFLVDGNGEIQIAHERIITLGETFGNVVAVSSGLKIGDQIVTTGATLIADGESVQVTP